MRNKRAAPTFLLSQVSEKPAFPFFFRFSIDKFMFFLLRGRRYTLLLNRAVAVKPRKVNPVVRAEPRALPGRHGRCPAGPSDHSISERHQASNRRSNAGADRKKKSSKPRGEDLGEPRTDPNQSLRAENLFPAGSLAPARRENADVGTQCRRRRAPQRRRLFHPAKPKIAERKPPGISTSIGQCPITTIMLSRVPSGIASKLNNHG